jgi:hypothetical protein
MQTEPPAVAAGPEATVDQHAVDQHAVDQHRAGPEASADGSQENGGIPIQDEWLRLHATDLIDRLRAWASDLDAREAQLNSRTSIQEHRERCFRLRQQDLATEFAEQQRSMERLRQEIEAQARRLAFQNDPG